MNVALWIGQGVLAAVFALSGALKSTQSKERMLATGQTGVRDVPLPAIRLIAACELLAVAVGRCLSPRAGTRIDVSTAEPARREAARRHCP